MKMLVTIFEIGNFKFAINSECVEEVLHMQPTDKKDEYLNYLFGFVSYKEKQLPAINICNYLHLPNKKHFYNTIILKQGICLFVNNFKEEEIDTEKFQFIRNLYSINIKGIIKHKKENIILLRDELHFNIKSIKEIINN
jgi:chemotaxis signal transduction protein